ncbi:MAG: trypsin-like serine protease [Clostridia bacterium]|nr:trypsin-like serine protease [Clostridia bacterium]
MEFPKYIVKVIGTSDVGTGILIDNDLILTASHLMHQEEYKIELHNGDILKAKEYPNNENEIIGLLKLERPVNENINHLLTQDYTPNEDDKWEIYGYITKEQIMHYIKGIGTHSIIEEERISDMQASNISVGQAINYKGLSGSPVIVDEMIIGIVQEQRISADRASEIKVSSVSSFVQYINERYIEANRIKKSFKEKMNIYTEQQIQKNIKSGKYIPEIFVEQNNFKEYMRFFAEPKLFINKAIDEIQSLNYKDVNEFLKKNFRNTINFRITDKIENDEELLKASEELSEDLKKARKLIEDKNQMKELLESGLDLYDRETRDYYNRALQFDFSDIQENIEYIRYRYLILTNGAGQGKTNFICDFTKNFLLKKNFYVLYINAYEVDKDLYEFVCDKIISFLNNKSIEYILDMLKEEYEKTFKPFVIVIDGLNENNKFDDFSNVVRQFLERIDGFNFIKVIMTTRDEFYDEKFKNIDTGIYSKNFKRVKMFNYNQVFQDRIFWGYLKFFDITIRRYSLLKNIFDRLSRDTLLLRFFCEANKGERQLYMYDIYKYNTFQMYIDKKIEAYNNKKFGSGKLYNNVLDKIIDYMINSCQYYNIPIDILNSEEVELVHELVLNDVVLKDDIIIKEGFLNEQKTVISFTFDEFRDFCMAKYIAKKFNKEQIEKFIKDLNQKSNVSIKEGVYGYLFFIGRMCSKDLVEILKTSDDYNIVYWENIFKLVDEKISDEDIEIIKNEFLNDGENKDKIILDLIFRYDTLYFKKLNIKNLYNIMDSFCEKDYEEYQSFIRAKFEPEFSNNYYSYGVRPIWPYDKMIENFKSILRRKNSRIYKELFKITIYLYNVSSWKTNEFWELYIKYLPDMAIETLYEMNNNVPEEINKNIKDIAYHIVSGSIMLKKDVKDKLQMIYNKNNTKIEKNTVLEELLKYLKKKEDDNEDY